MRQVRSLVLRLWIGFAFAIALFASPAARADLAANVTVGDATAIENLTLFPLFAQVEEDVGKMTTLESALLKKQAEVREIAGKPGRGAHADSAEVNRLVIQNKGDTAVYVLAGTIVKGGKQDRQIGQDFVVAPHSTVSVDAFCVEQGRWTAEREGARTNGKFGATKAMATSDVRAAAQYKRDQGEVWSKVSDVNRAHKKAAPSGTLLATLDDGEVGKRREVITQAIEQALNLASSQGKMVGFAYAVDGQMKSVRWFANTQIFALFRAPLVQTAALDALTTQGEHGRRTAAPVDKSKVGDLVNDVDAASASEERDTPASNRNEYKEGRGAYGSKTRLKGRPASAAPVSQDYVAK